MSVDSEQDCEFKLSARRILVVGHQPHNAGKTTLCKALIYGFKDRGVNLVPFKPHSGTSLTCEI